MALQGLPRLQGHPYLELTGGRSNPNEAIPCDHLADLVMSFKSLQA